MDHTPHLGYRTPRRSSRHTPRRSRKRGRVGLRLEQLESRLALAANLSVVADLATGFMRGGIAGTDPTQMTESGGGLFFSGFVFDASDGTWPGREPRSAGLWVTDGTTAGTRLVKEIVPFAGGWNGFDQVLHLTNVSGTLYFAVARDGIHGTELWKSDGTEAGTVLVKRFDAGTYRHLAHLTALGGKLAFELNVTTQNQFGGLPQESQLWVSDGSVAGTVRVATFKSIDTGENGQYASSLRHDTPFFVHGQSIYFSATHTPASGPTYGELHRFDGTAVTSIRSFPTSFVSHVKSLTTRGGEVFFSWGNDVWRTDGTSTGTQLVTTTPARLPSLLTTIGDTVFFAASTGNLFAGDSIMSTDGTSAGTRTLLELEVASPQALSITTASGRAVIFAGKEFSTAADVTGWAIDTSSGATEQLGFFQTALNGDLAPRHALNVQGLAGRVYFTANDGIDGHELWSTDGTRAGTTIHDVWRPAPGSNDEAVSSSSDPDDLTAFGGSLYFSAFERQYGRELWRLTPSGPVVQRPTVTIASSTTVLGPDEVATVTFTLSEPSVDFTAADVTVSGGTLTGFSGSGASYIATFVPTANSSAAGTLAIAADAFTNAQGAGNLASDPLAIAIDTFVPGVGVVEAQTFEGDTGTRFVEVAVVLSAASSRPVSVTYATADGSAGAADGDYAAAAGTLTFAPGETRKAIRVAVRGDKAIEDDETFTVQLTNVVNAFAVEPVGTVTIQDDDAPAFVSVDDVEVTEGTGGSTTATFTIQLTAPRSHAVAVRYATLERTARPRDRDYRSVAGKVLIPAGQTSASVPVSVMADAKYEADEMFVFRIISATGLTIERPFAQCMIYNDDPLPMPTVSIGDVRLAEGNSAQRVFSFLVTLSKASPLPVSVDFATADGTAVAGRDYLETAGSLIFAPGMTRRSVTVWVPGDTVVEPTSQFGVVLLSATEATIGRDTGIGTIVNDDRAGSVRRSVTTATLAMLAAETSIAKPSVRRR